MWKKNVVIGLFNIESVFVKFKIMAKKEYYVHSTVEKVYVEGKKGCVARLCKISAEFYNDIEVAEVIMPCSFEKFKREALKRGYHIEDKHRPPWDSDVL
jgi:hypothetical protein